MKAVILLIGIAWLGMVSAGCTVRYSQSITGSIHKVQNYKLVNANNGTDVVSVSVGLILQGGTRYRPGNPRALELRTPGDARWRDHDPWYAYYIRSTRLRWR
jgi:hypothetical protein